MNSRQRRLMSELAAQFDCDLSETARGHARLVSRRTGAVVFGSGTPGDWREWKNIRAKLKRISQNCAP